MKETQPNEIIKQLLKDALENSQKGLIAKASKALVLLHKACKEFPFILWDDEQCLDLAKAFLIMYHFDILKSEEENIEIAHMAYLYAYRAMQTSQEQNNEDLLFDSLKELTLIVNTCEECFSHTIAKFYQPNKAELTHEEIHGSVLLANRVLPLVTYSFILDIEDTFHSFKDDEFLEDTCNQIESDYEQISDKLASEGKNIGKLCFKYVLKKVKEVSFEF